LDYPRRTVTPRTRTSRTARLFTQRWRRAVLALALSLLVFAQQGFVLHALSHLSSTPVATAAAGGGHDGKADNCGLCLAFAALGSAVPATTPELVDGPAAQGAVPVLVSAPASAGFTAGYHSRAPPRLA
jgi:hypothetical protein